MIPSLVSTTPETARKETALLGAEKRGLWGVGPDSLQAYLFTASPDTSHLPKGGVREWKRGHRAVAKQCGDSAPVGHSEKEGREIRAEPQGLV